mgnify:CR=1 FL=1
MGSYFIRRPEGNVLVDSPRFTPPLVKRLEAMGGIRYLYLTHRDDVADHQEFHDRFGCDRILHQDDITAAMARVEQPLTGLAAIQLAPDLQIFRYLVTPSMPSLQQWLLRCSNA